MTDRLTCCVPFCRRTRKPGPSEWICSVHWPMVSTTTRRRKAKVYRMYRREFGREPYWTFPAGSRERIRAVRLDRLCGKIWDRCKREAIERAVGL